LLVVLALILVAAQFVRNYVTTKDNALNILAINAGGNANEEFEEAFLTGFLEENGVNTSKYEVSVNRSVTVNADSADYSSAYSEGTLLTLFTAQQVDLFFADYDYFRSMASEGYAKNLEDYLTEEELAALDTDSLVYVTVQEDDGDDEGETGDGDEAADADGENNGNSDDYERTDGEMILAGIRLPQAEGWLGEMGWYQDGADVVVGISASVQHEDLAMELLREVLSYE
ncbi:MAG: hypothetical protein LUI07_01920, partial [Lachnospiraceae bacterium]|nr:hypothetical protein [Lachnospiraceae bacterium]